MKVFAIFGCELCFVGPKTVFMSHVHPWGGGSTFSPWKVAEALSTSKEQSLKNRNNIFKDPLVSGGKPWWLASSHADFGNGPPLSSLSSFVGR